MIIRKKKFLQMIRRYRRIVSIVQEHGGHIYDKYMKIVRVVYDENEDE